MAPQIIPPSPTSPAAAAASMPNLSTRDAVAEDHTFKGYEAEYAANANANQALKAARVSATASGPADAPDPDHTFKGFEAEYVANAIVNHAQKMDRLAKELAAANPGSADASYQGHDSSAIAQAIQNYVGGHQDEPWPQKFTSPNASPGQPSSFDPAAMLVISPLSTSPNPGPVFALSTLVHDQYWMSIFLCIVWIASGLFLLFFGWASFFWGINLGTSQKRIVAKAKKPSKFGPLFAGAPIAGGVGGIVVGFLFFSFLSTVVTAAICVAEVKSVGATWFFIIWLLPGFFGAFLAGHWPLLARTFTGLLAGASFTLVVTAMFGIHTLIIRVVFIAVFTSLITAPLLIPRRNAMHFHLLNICTSIIGMVIFLDGVAVFAPPRTSSDSWIDLWVVLFAADASSSEASASKKWGTSAFKGFIAAAILGALVGFAFEFVFHKHAAEDPDMEWNNYLGSYTQRLENHDTEDPKDRAGSFEPAPTSWQKFSRAFTSPTRPAAHGNIGSPHDPEKSPLTDLPSPKSRRHKAHRARKAAKSIRKGGPAKFNALDKLAESDSESGTDYESDDSLRKLHPSRGGKSMLSKLDADELADELKPLSASGDSTTGRLPRPPSYRTNSGNSARVGSTGSGLSGTTANSASIDSARLANSNLPAERALSIYKDRDALASPTRPNNSRHATMSPPPPFPDSQPASPLNPSFPATPSLVNAITRIQAAQAQARAWYETRPEADAAGSKLSSSSNQNKAKTSPKSLNLALPSKAGEEQSTRSSTPQPKPEAGSFQSWWGKEVKGEPKPSS